MVAIIDYDAGNIGSVQKAVSYLGKDAVLTRNPKDIQKADHVILPGVGAFGSAMENLHRYHLEGVIAEIIQKQTPFLGICLGLQVLFEKSEEAPDLPGLSILSGEILRFPKGDEKVPHMGWNLLETAPDSQLFHGLSGEIFVYFVHSYYLKAHEKETVKAKSQYMVSFDASIEKGNLFACQFHPEKSGGVGLEMLRNFLNI